MTERLRNVSERKRIPVGWGVLEKKGNNLSLEGSRIPEEESQPCSQEGLCINYCSPPNHFNTQSFQTKVNMTCFHCVGAGICSWPGQVVALGISGAWGSGCGLSCVGLKTRGGCFLDDLDCCYRVAKGLQTRHLSSV
jgi:Pyruvate/2-oxoacid:ferredoxin oxidoreductase delta subunit